MLGLRSGVGVELGVGNRGSRCGVRGDIEVGFLVLLSWRRRNLQQMDRDEREKGVMRDGRTQASDVPADFE